MKKSWKYHKIMSIYKRGKDGSFFIGEYSTPEIEMFTRKGDRIITKIKYKDLIN